MDKSLKTEANFLCHKELRMHSFFAGISKILFGGLVAVLFAACLSPFGDIDPLKLLGDRTTSGSGGSTIEDPLKDQGLLIVYNASTSPIIPSITVTQIENLGTGIVTHPNKVITKNLPSNPNYAPFWLDAGNYNVTISFDPGSGDTTLIANKSIPKGKDAQYLYFTNASGPYFGGITPTPWDPADPINDPVGKGYIAVNNRTNKNIASIEIESQSAPFITPRVQVEDSTGPFAQNTTFTSKALDPEDRYFVTVTVDGVPTTMVIMGVVFAGKVRTYVWDGDTIYDETIPPTTPDGKTAQVVVVNASTNAVLQNLLIDNVNYGGYDIDRGNESKYAVAADVTHNLSFEAYSISDPTLRIGVVNQAFKLAENNVYKISYPIPGTPTPPSTGNVAEGSSPGILDDTNRTSMGLIIVKNLTKDKDLTSVRFAPSPPRDPPAPPAGGYYAMNGPAIRNQQSIVLNAGGWNVTGYYDTVGETEPQLITVAAGTVKYIYFYKSLIAPGYAITDTWEPPPYDAWNNEDPDTIIADDEGFLHVINGSEKAILSKIKYQPPSGGIEMNFVGLSQLGPGMNTANDFILPRAATVVQFWLPLKQRWSDSIPVRIRNGTTYTITYLDSMDNNEPIEGYGTLIVNNHTNKGVSYVQFRDENGQPVNQYHEAVAPEWRYNFSIPSNLSNDVIMTADEKYILKFNLENYIISKVITVPNKSNVTVTLNEEDFERPGGGGSVPTNGALQVINSYRSGYIGPRPDFKIFKFYLDSGSSYKYDATTPYAPIGVGESGTKSGIPEGLYTLKIVAGSYAWSDYNNSASGTQIVPGLTLTEALITYDVGQIYISAGSTRIYRFDGYDIEKDTPDGFVTFSIVYTGPGASQVPRRIEIASRPRPLGTLTGAWQRISDTKELFDSMPDATAQTITAYDTWPGHWTGSQAGINVPQQNVVWAYMESLTTAGQAGPFMIPPGVYWTRYSDNSGTGQIYGEGAHDRWRLVDLRWSARQTVGLSMDNTVGTNWTPVTQKPGTIYTASQQPDIEIDPLLPANGSKTITIHINRHTGGSSVEVRYRAYNGTSNYTWDNIDTASAGHTFTTTLDSFEIADNPYTVGANSRIQVYVKEADRAVSARLKVKLTNGVIE